MIRALSARLGRRGRITPLVVWCSLAGLLQGLTFLLLVPLLREFLAGRFDAAVPWLWACLGCGVAFLVFDAIAAVMGYDISVYGICDQLMRSLGAALPSKSLGWFDSGTRAKVLKVLTTDMNTLGHVPSLLLPVLIVNLVAGCTLAVGTLLYDWRLGLVMLAAVPVAMLLYRRARLGLSSPQQKIHAANETLAARMIEFSQLQPVLRASEFSGVDGTWRPLEDALAAERDASLNKFAAQTKPYGLFMLTIIAVFAIALAGGAALATSGGIEPAVFIALVLAVARFTEPLSLFVSYAEEVWNAERSLAAVVSIIDAPLLAEPATPSLPQGHELRLDGVDFRYQDGPPVLTGISVAATASGMTALVGPSGAGKTTVLRLFSRFWDPDGGTASLGGQPLPSLGTAQIMDAEALVFQNVYLFNSTIRENLMIAKPDCTQDELDAVARAAALTEVIGRLPDGWDSKVGEGGQALSGGERQRVSIARALLKDAPIVLLDEATAAIDGESEATVTATLRELARTKTVAVISHRLSTIEAADRICVIDQGCVVEQGTHAQLLAAGGTYALFWREQHAAASWRLRQTD